MPDLLTSRDSAFASQSPPRLRAKVLLPLPVETPFDYAIPDNLSIQTSHPDARHNLGDLKTGDWVSVPFGPRKVHGVVWTLTGDEDNPLPFSKLKPLTSKLDAPPLSSDMIHFVEWVANYTLFPMGTVLRLVMRKGDALIAPKPVTAWIRKTEAIAASAKPDTNSSKATRLTPARQKALSVISHTPQTTRQIIEASGVSNAVIRGLAKTGLIESVGLDPDHDFDLPDLSRKGADLSALQANAAQSLVAMNQARKPGTALLDGVTGSGKTEVYLEAVRYALARDTSAQVLILLPEIGLTLPFLKRIEAGFGAAPAPWHSDIGTAMRRRVWRRVLEGQARLVVGARSALFLPFKNLKLIVVDEEHDSAYKQEEGVLYQGRDMAVARGALAGFPVILASATPALETMINATEGRYQKVTLPSRYGRAQLPDVSLIDMRKHPPEKTAPAADAHTPPPTPEKRWLSPVLIDGVSESLVKGEQALLFLNRRGYAPLTLCRKCGHRMMSPHSDTCLVEHRFENRLICHHTGYSIPKPKACPQCNAVGSLAACGPGVERIADEARERWPHARLEILSSDHNTSSEHLRRLLKDMQDGSIDILVATQAAAKGHNFPNLTMVGVVDADLGLSGGDLRAAERTYQLLSQVAGRAGRAEKPGRALLQTYAPEAPVLKALVDGNRDQFLAAEASGRMAMHFPPFGRIAGIILRGHDSKLVHSSAETMIKAAPNANGIDIWGPAPAPLYRLKGETRIRMLVRARRDVNLQAFLKDWVSTLKLPPAIRRTIDIDPYSFM